MSLRHNVSVVPHTRGLTVVHHDVRVGSPAILGYALSQTLVFVRHPSAKEVMRNNTAVR